MFPNSQEVVGDLTLVVKQVLHLGAVSITWWKQREEKWNTWQQIEEAFTCTEKVFTLYLHGIQTCKLELHRICIDSASHCFGNQTQPYLRKGWPQPVKGYRIEMIQLSTNMKFQAKTCEMTDVMSFLFSLQYLCI